MVLTDSKKRYLADISLVAFAVLQGAAFVAGKDALVSITPMFLLAYRFGIATLFFYGFLSKRIGKLSKEDVVKGTAVGTVLFSAFAAQTYGLLFTTASKQGFLLSTYVVMVPFLYWLVHKKRPRLKAFVGSVITIAAIYIISMQGSLSLELGDALTLVGAFLFGVHILSIEHFTKNMNVFKLAFVQILVALVWSLLTAFITEPIPAMMTGRVWYSLLFLGVFSTFVCFTIQTVAQKYTSSSHASIIMSMESVFAAILGVVLLGETMTSNIIIGFGLIFIAVLVIELDIKPLGRHHSRETEIEDTICP